MLKHQNNEKIKIAILGISAQNKAILEFYFSNAGKSHYKEVSENEADAFIFDHDYPGALGNWEEISKTNNKPALMLSISEKKITSNIWLAKPLTAKAITEAAAKIREMINVEIPVEEKIPASVIATIQEPEEELELAIAGGSDDDVFNEVEETEATEELETVATETIETQSVEKIVIEEQEPSTIDAKENANQSSSEDTEIDDLLASLIQGEGRRKINLDIDETPDFDGYKRTDDKAEDSLLVEDPSPVENHLSVEDSLAVEDSLSIEDSVSVDDSLQLDSMPALEEPASAIDEVQDSGENKPASLDFDSTTTSNKESDDTLDVGFENAHDLDLFNFDSLSTKETDEVPDSQKQIDEDVESISLSEYQEDDGYSDLLEEVGSTIVEPTSSNNTESATEIESDELEDLIDLDLGITPPVAESLAVPQSPEEELQSLLSEIRHEADKKDVGITETTSKFKHTKKASGLEADKSHQPTNADKRWGQLCGNNNDIRKAQDVKQISFDPNKHLLFALLEHVKQARHSKHVLRLKYDDIVIVIDTETDSIYCNYPIQTDAYANLCFETIDANNIKVHALDYSEIRLYRKKMEDKPEKSNEIEAFIWTTSLLTSKGRLRVNTDITKTFCLNAWPNLTRVEKIPHAMNIAAVFSKHPGSLQEVAKWLNIPQRYVFAFYNAALSLDMVEFDSKKFATSPFAFEENKKAGNKAKERSFFGRLLKRLTT